MNDSRERRAAENEDVFRRINERVEELSRGVEALSLICECSRVDCTERLTGVSPEQYAEVRTRPEQFFVLPGHEQEDVEEVVERHGTYLVVAKHGVAGETARRDA